MQTEFVYRYSCCPNQWDCELCKSQVLRRSSWKTIGDIDKSTEGAPQPIDMKLNSDYSRGQWLSTGYSGQKSSATNVDLSITNSNVPINTKAWLFRTKTRGSSSQHRILFPRSSKKGFINRPFNYVFFPIKVWNKFHLSWHMDKLTGFKNW